MVPTPNPRTTAPLKGAGRSPHRTRQRGISLFVVIVFVLLSMLLALWASRTSLFNEMVVGNDADYQRAFEAAQALLQDAELDIRGENADGSACANPGAVTGICRLNTADQIPLETQEVGPLLASQPNLLPANYTGFVARDNTFYKPIRDAGLATGKLGAR